MAQIEKTITVNVCDLCDSQEHVFDRCQGCGKYVCYDCKRGGKAVEYRHGVWSQGTGDGVYCNECDASKTDDPLHAAFVTVKRLRAEHDAYSAEFDNRRRAAEAILAETPRPYGR